MNIFDLRDPAIRDCRDFIAGFVNIRDPRVRSPGGPSARRALPVARALVVAQPEAPRRGPGTGESRRGVR